MSSQKISTIKIPVQDFKRIETPLDYKGYRNYICIVDVLDLPDDISQWNSGSNVRDAKSRGKVPAAIREGLLENELFVYMNRGIVLLADSIQYDNKLKTIELVFDKEKKHGVGDGGHTRLIISEEKKSLLMKQKEDPNFVNRSVRVEILVGFNINENKEIVGARNTSNQVKEQSLLELENKFEDIKKALTIQRYSDDIAYKEFEYYKDSSISKPIDIRDIISIMYMFDIDTFNEQKHPISAYNSKNACMIHFKKTIEKKNSIFKKIYPILPDILDLRDHIYLSLPELYNKAARDIREDVTKGRFGTLTGVTPYENKTVELPFSVNKSNYRIPISFIYPILASFRVFLEKKKNSLMWIPDFDYKKILETEVGIKLALALTDRVLEDRNPTKTGRSASFWSNCYQITENARLRLENELLKKQKSLF